MKLVFERASAALITLWLCAIAVISTAPVSATAQDIPAPPVLVYPADGDRFFDPVTSAYGTGIPGAVINVTGSSLQQTHILEDGTFVAGFLPPLFLGKHSLTLTQTLDGETSEATTISLSVIPQPPTIDVPTNGATFQSADALTSLSGTSIDHTIIRASVNDVLQSDQPNADGVWTLTLDRPLRPGLSTISVVQEFEGAVSDPATVTVTVIESALPPAPAPTPTPSSTTGAPPGNEPSDAARVAEELAGTGPDLGVLLTLAGVLVAGYRVDGNPIISSFPHPTPEFGK